MDKFPPPLTITISHDSPIRHFYSTQGYSQLKLVFVQTLEFFVYLLYANGEEIFISCMKKNDP